MTISPYDNAVTPFVNGQPVSDANPLPVGSGGGGSGQAFSPEGNTVNIAATTSSAHVALPAGDQVTVTNPPGGALAFIAFGDNTVTADAETSMPIIPGAAYTLTPPAGATDIAAITGSGTATIYITGGSGN